MAEVLSVIFASIVLGFTRIVSGSVSAKTGKALFRKTELYVATNVKGETMTSSPASTPFTYRAVINAVVPLAVVTHRFAPHN
jgi:hypothetical protein